MKKIIFLCVAVFLFTVSIVNVVWFQGKKEQKAHLTLNNIVALAKGEYVEVWVYPCDCAEETVKYSTVTGQHPGEYTTEAKYECKSGYVSPYSSHNNDQCREGTYTTYCVQMCNIISYQPLVEHCFLYSWAENNVSQAYKCMTHTYYDHWTLVYID